MNFILNFPGSFYNKDCFEPPDFQYETTDFSSAHPSRFEPSFDILVSQKPIIWLSWRSNYNFFFKVILCITSSGQDVYYSGLGRLKFKGMFYFSWFKWPEVTDPIQNQRKKIERKKSINIQSKSTNIFNYS